MTARLRLPLLLFASPLELATCTDALKVRTNHPFAAERIGVGPYNARQSTAHILDHMEPPSLVLALGMATWLSPAKLPTSPVWAREVKRMGQVSLRPTLDLGWQTLQSFSLHSARLVTTTRPVVDRDSGKAFLEDAQVEMADTESYGILAECVERDLACGVIRAVSHRAGVNIPISYQDQIVAGMALLGQVLVHLLQWHHQQAIRQLS